MNDIIQIGQQAIGEATIQTVNARELHAFLEVGKDFSNWIKDRIEQYDFKENSDFVVFADSGENPRGGRPAKEYAISLDMAKELAMVERNEKGKQARQYFIECERRAKAAVPAGLPNFLDPATAAIAWAEQHKLREAAEAQAKALEAKTAELEPKAEALERISASPDTLTFTQAAKVLGIKRKDLAPRLQALGWIYRQNKSWVAREPLIRSGCLQYKEASYTDDTGMECCKPYCHITQKGLTVLAQKINGGLSRAA